MTDQIIKTGDEYNYTTCVVHVVHVVHMVNSVVHNYNYHSKVKGQRLKKRHFCHSYWISPYRSRSSEDNHQKSCCNGKNDGRGQNFPETLRKGTMSKMTLHHKADRVSPGAHARRKKEDMVRDHWHTHFINNLQI